MGGSMNGGGYSAPGQGVNLGSLISMLGGQNTGGQGYGTPQAFNPYTQASRMAAQNAGGMGRQTQAMPYTGQQMEAAQQTPVGGRGVQTRAMPPTKSPVQGGYDIPLPITRGNLNPGGRGNVGPTGPTQDFLGGGRPILTPGESGGGGTAGIQIGSGKWNAPQQSTGLASRRQILPDGGPQMAPPVKAEPPAEAKPATRASVDLVSVTGDPPPRLSLGADGNPTIAPMQGQSPGVAPVSGGGGRTPEQKADREYAKWRSAQRISDAQTRAGTNPWGVMGMPDPRKGGFDPNLYGQMSQLGQQNALGGEYAGMLPGMGYTGGTVNQGLLDQFADWQRQNTSFGTPDENGVLWMTVNSPSGPIRVPARQYGR